MEWNRMIGSNHILGLKCDILSFYNIQNELKVLIVSIIPTNQIFYCYNKV